MKNTAFLCPNVRYLIHLRKSCYSKMHNYLDPPNVHIFFDLIINFQYLGVLGFAISIYRNGSLKIGILHIKRD